MQAVLIVSAGNNGQNGRLAHGLPALLGNNHINAPIFVVGAAALNGNAAAFSEELEWGTDAMIWAPGDSIRCAGLPNQRDTVEKSGTSFAAPMI